VVKFLFTGLSLTGQNAGSEYRIVKKIHLPGEGGWDYLSVDETSARLFISHATVVQVVDLRTGVLTGTINDTPGVHGIAIAEDLNKAFISVGRTANATVLDAVANKVIATIALKGKPEFPVSDGHGVSRSIYNYYFYGKNQ
jgi:hypothetical protein